ncbi:MAG: Nramp family divalent metal transporter [Acidobacteria bacterium]|nr:Nramp family divalent metal transporter [Acidobacteriota bacterium]
MKENDEAKIQPTQVAIERRGLKLLSSARYFFRNLGPGLITGAADDDPSGISTYSTAGASFGYGMLWTALLSLPLMTAVQLMCARIGLVSGRGLASVLRRFYPRSLLWFACSLVFIANTVNIAADLGGMAEAAELLTGLPSFIFVPIFTAIILLLLIFASYRNIARIFKWLTLVLFAYVGSAFLAHPQWSEVIRATLLPKISLDSGYLMTLVAILGTTISPYLFFWQAAEEVEEEKSMGRKTVGQRMGASRKELKNARNDVVFGMSISVIVFYFIILTTGATLYKAGLRDIQTAREAAEALRPLAGDAAYILFAVGLIGTGFLGVPVLAGSAAYAISEAGAWRSGINEKPRMAKKFYSVVAFSMFAGMALEYSGVNAIKMLFTAAVVNGLLAPPLLVIIMMISNNPKVMGEHVNGRMLNLLGALAILVMGGAAIATLISFI